MAVKRTGENSYLVTNAAEARNYDTADGSVTYKHNLSGEMKEARQFQVSEQCDRLEANIQHLIQVVNKLGERLEPVLSLDVIRQKDEREPDGFVPLAGSLATINELLENQVDRLESMLRRLEL